MSAGQFVSTLLRFPAILVWVLPASAQASVQSIRWTHPNPSQVAGFKVHVGSASYSYQAHLDAGKPAPVNGVYTYPLNVADDRASYVAISAYDAQGNESAYSNERSFGPVTSSTTTTTSTTSTTSTTLPPQPPPNALWWDSFESVSIGGHPSGWYDSGPNNSLVRDSLFDVVSLSGDRAFSTSSTAVNVHSHYTAPGTDAWSDYEYRGKMRISDDGGGIGVTAYSQYPVRDAYYRVRRLDQTGWTAFRMSPHPDGRQLTCSSDTSGVVPAAGRWYRFRVQVRTKVTHTAIRAKVWPATVAQPDGWTIDCFDAAADRLTEGRIGVWSMGPGVKYWDDLQVVELSTSLPPSGLVPPPPPDFPE